LFFGKPLAERDNREERALKSNIRPAEAGDIEDLAFLVYLSGKSHMRRSIYDLMFQGSEEYQQEVLRSLLQVRPWFHFSMFLVADIDGKAVASLCGYSELETGGPKLSAAVREIGWSNREVEEAISRLEPFHRVFPPHPRDAWILEHAATMSGYRECGLMTTLFKTFIDTAHERGYRSVELGIFTGNLPARRAYEKLGFMVTEEYADTAFEELFACPGMTRMVLSL
jgi:RimJ/RimL family protein N-acetyltransferase